MEARVHAIRHANADECIWLLEHPPLYTAGTSANAQDLLDTQDFPVYQTGRGGQYTYHGPGQRVAYVMLDLKTRLGPAPDLCRFLWIRTLQRFDVEGERREGRIGIWVATPGGEAKIAALGIRIRQGVSFHGVALNVHPDLSHYTGIVPCGISQFGVTSLAALRKNATMAEVDAALKESFTALDWA